MDYKKILEDMENKEGFFHHNNYHVIEADEKNVIIKANLTENSMNPYGIAHGGIIFGLGDTVMGMVAASTGKKAVTLSSNITYLRPAIGNFITAKGELIKDGKTTCFVRANIYNEEEKLIAAMDASFYYIEEGKK